VVTLREGQVICRRCGSANEPDDRFCGSCSAFLEWDGGSAGSLSLAAPSTSAGDPDMAGAARVVADPAGTADLAPAGEGSGGSLVRCPECGIANPGTRTFCQSCGARLVSAARISTRSPEQIAAAVAATHGPAVQEPAPVVVARGGAGVMPAGAGSAHAMATPAGASRGYAGWLVLAVLGIAVGVAVVLGSSLLRSEDPASGATNAPAATDARPAISAAPTAGPSAGAARSTTTQGMPFGGTSSIAIGGLGVPSP
jgi:hypothetical protein